MLMLFCEDDWRVWEAVGVVGMEWFELFEARLWWWLVVEDLRRWEVVGVVGVEGIISMWRACCNL